MGLDVCHAIPVLLKLEDWPIDYFTVEELSSAPGYIERHHHLIVEREEEEGNIRLIYFEDIGYQRKGMSRKFYEDFVNEKPYFDIEDLKKAYEYLQADHISTLEELQQNFQKNFIDNFIPGESVFYASW